MDAFKYEHERAECRERLAKALGRSEIPSFVWGEVDDLVYSAIFGGEDEWDELETTAKNCLLKEYGRPERTNREVPSEVSIILDEYSRARAETNSEVAALFADRHPDVRKFRNAHLGGEEVRLTPEQAQEFLDGDQPEYILDEMFILARKLGWRYRWTYSDVWRFLLTEEAPYIQPLRVHYESVNNEKHYPNMAQITMIVEPWVDARELGRVYREIQRQVLNGDNRKRSMRALEAVRLTARQRRRHGERSWGEITEYWKQIEKDPRRRYDNRGAIERAYKRFLGITYQSPVLTPVESDR